MPLPIVGLVVRYTTNNLIGRRLILRPCVSRTGHSSTCPLPGLILTFARLSLIVEQIIDALLSRSLPLGKHAWLNRIQIAAIVRRINGNFLIFLFAQKFQLKTISLCCVSVAAAVMISSYPVGNIWFRSLTYFSLELTCTSLNHKSSCLMRLLVAMHILPPSYLTWVCQALISSYKGTRSARALINPDG